MRSRKHSAANIPSGLCCVSRNTSESVLWLIDRGSCRLSEWLPFRLPQLSRTLIQYRFVTLCSPSPRELATRLCDHRGTEARHRGLCESKGLQMLWMPAKRPEYSPAKSSSKRMANGHAKECTGEEVRSGIVDEHSPTVQNRCGGVSLRQRCGYCGWTTLLPFTVLVVALLGSLRCAEGAAAPELPRGELHSRSFFTCLNRCGSV